VRGAPYIRGRRVADELARADWLHGAEEKTKDPLVRDPLAGVLRIGDVHGGIAHALLYGLVRGRCGAIEVTPSRLAPAKDGTVSPFQSMKLWASRRTEGDVESPTVVALEAEMITPKGAASWRTKEEAISRWYGGELVTARGRVAAAAQRGTHGGVEDP
jgi:hypothetical protein